MDMSLVCTLKKSGHVLPGVLELPAEEGQNLVLKGSLVLLVLFILVLKGSLVLLELFILVCHTGIPLDDVGLMQCESSISVLFVLPLCVCV